MSFGQRLKVARTKKRLTQFEVAEILGIDDTTISKYENDKSEPDNATLTKLAGLYGESIDSLLGREVPNVGKKSDLDVSIEKSISNLTPAQKAKLLKMIEIVQDDQ